jgi:large subunit ribosomal protein L18
MSKKDKRIKRARKARAKIRELLVPRLSVHRTGKHIYAQVIDSVEDKVIASASTVQKAVEVENAGNIAAAKVVGKLVAERTKDAGVTKVAFDRSGFKYHGRVQALAEAAREAGLEF